MSEPFDLRHTFAHLKATGAEPVPTGPDFWAELVSRDRNYPGRLAMILPMTADFPHWERHPAGEELIVMLSGACTLILETAAGETRTHLEAGKAVLVPTGVWHRAEILEPGEALFVTEGEGSEHKPLSALHNV